MIVRLATLQDIQPLSALFDEYRQSYGQSSNLNLSTKFLKQRFENAESIIFVNLKGDALTGFILLYRGFSSIRCSSYYILDDVYVAPAFRRQGAARQLIDTAILFAQQEGSDKIWVDTPQANPQSHQLYESMGFKQHNQLRSYEYPLNQSRRRAS
jgi:ribosomal protein S18 acetylase RimI-like enzyme